ncbi:hypothetical protein AB1286_26640 [Trinickia sp. NRRL B-1857]
MKHAGAVVHLEVPPRPGCSYSDDAVEMAVDPSRHSFIGSIFERV